MPGINSSALPQAARGGPGQTTSSDFLPPTFPLEPKSFQTILSIAANVPLHHGTCWLFSTEWKPGPWLFSVSFCRFQRACCCFSYLLCAAQAYFSPLLPLLPYSKLSPLQQWPLTGLLKNSFIYWSIIVSNVVLLSAVQSCESAIWGWSLGVCACSLCDPMDCSSSISYKYTYITSLLLLSSHSSRSSQSAELSSVYTHGSVYMSVLLSQFIPPFSSCSVSTSSFSTSVSLFLLWSWVHLYHFLDITYMCYYMMLVCLFLT